MSAYLSALRIATAAVAIAGAMDNASAIGTGTVTAGVANITSPNANTTVVTQTSNKTVINWTNFNTTSGQTVDFVQPSNTAIALNIINGGPTSFYGNLNANGKVWLINSDGMLFGSGATINVGSLLLSTAGISNPTGSGFFTNTGSSYSFDQPGAPTASITLDHTYISALDLTLKQLGDVVIQAPQVTVTDSSTLSANSQLLAGQTFTADFNGDGMINFMVINTPVSAIVPGATSSVYVGDNTILGHGQDTIGALIYQDAVLDHVINLGGQYEVGSYNQATNPEHVVITGTPDVYETIVPNPGGPTTTTPSNNPNASVGIDTLYSIRNLTRPLASLGDESVKDTTVDPNVANVTYERPYLVSVPNSIAQGSLTLLAPPAQVAQGDTNALGNLSPSAGGAMAANGQDLGNLSPSAGGTAKTVNCANAFLDAGWSDPTGSKCPN